MDIQSAISRVKLLFSDASNEDYPFTEVFAEALQTVVSVAEKIDTNHEEAYYKGLNDAWKLLIKIKDIPHSERNEIFGLVDNSLVNIIEKLTPQEAFAKIEAYEKEQAEIKVGDVVTTINGKCGYIVTNIQLPNTLHCVNSRNGFAQQMKISSCKKTGRHVDIQSMFNSIGG